MIVSVITENTVCKANEKSVKAEHGLSLHIETNGQKILFDTGQSDLFIKNAQKMGIDLSEVDYLFISHGHIDHGGGIKHFLKVNKSAKIFMHRKAVKKYYTKIFGFLPYYVGLSQKNIRKNSDRIHFVDHDQTISENIQLITNFPNEFPLPKSNLSLFEKQNKQFIHDKFKHEIVLILKENNKNIVFTACSHSGIMNMVEKAKENLKGKNIHSVFGGFHTFNPITKKKESQLYLKTLAAAIEKHDSTFFTGHCTGIDNFYFLKEMLGSKIQSMNVGEVIEI